MKLLHPKPACRRPAAHHHHHHHQVRQRTQIESLIAWLLCSCCVDATAVCLCNVMFKSRAQQTVARVVRVRADARLIVGFCTR
jgi:hypothetical protein